MFPPQEGFHTRQLHASQANLRLIVREELIALDPLPDLIERDAGWGVRCMDYLQHTVSVDYFLSRAHLPASWCGLPGCLWASAFVCPNFVNLTRDLRLAASSSGNLRQTRNRATIAASSNAAGSTSHATALWNSRDRFQHAAPWSDGNAHARR